MVSSKVPPPPRPFSALPYPSSSSLNFSRGQSLEIIKSQILPSFLTEAEPLLCVLAHRASDRLSVYLWPFRMPTYCMCQNTCQVRVRRRLSDGHQPMHLCTMLCTCRVCQIIYILSLRCLPQSVRTQAPRRQPPPKR